MHKLYTSATRGEGGWPKTYENLRRGEGGLTKNLRRSSEGIHFRSVVIFSIIKKVETFKIDQKIAYKNYM